MGACYTQNAHFKTVTNPSSNADGLREPPRSYKPKGEPLKGEPRPAPPQPQPRGTHVLQVAEDEVLQRSVKDGDNSSAIRPRGPQGLSYPPLPVGPAPQTPAPPRPAPPCRRRIRWAAPSPSAPSGPARGTPWLLPTRRRHTLPPPHTPPEVAARTGSRSAGRERAGDAGMLEDSAYAAAIGRREDRVSTAPAAHV